MLSEETIIFDNGTSNIKVGFSGYDYPRLVFPPCKGILRSCFSPNFTYSKGYYIGSEVVSYRHFITLENYQIERGRIKLSKEDEYLMPEIWEHCYNKLLRNQSDKNPVFIAEPLNITIKERELNLQTFFEDFNVPAYFCSYQTVLSTYSIGKKTGLVVECGEGLTQIMPVYENCSFKRNKRVLEFAGIDLKKQLKELINKQGIFLGISKENRFLERAMKDLFFSVEKNESEKENILLENKNEYMMPDGEKIYIKKDDLSDFVESFFNPSSIKGQFSNIGIAQQIIDSLKYLDTELYESFLGEIILTGGVSKIKNFEEKLLYEVKKNLPSNWNLKIGVNRVKYSPENSAWIGASVLSTLDSFKHSYIKKSEYLEEGFSAIKRKCF